MCIHIIHIVTKMVNITLSVSEELHKKMKSHTELKWSDIARAAFEKKLVELELVDKLLKGGMLTENDAEILGHRIKGRIRERLNQKRSA